MGRFNVALDELVVFGAAAPGMTVTHVELVIEQLFVVGADIKRHGDGAPGIDAATCGVERQLPDRDLDAAHAPVPDAQDPLGVGAEDQVDVVGTQPERLEGFGDLVRAVDGQIQSPLPAVLAGEPLDRFTDRRGVHHRHQLWQMLRQHLEIEDFMAVVQLIKMQIAGQIRWHALQLPPDSLCLLFQGEYARREPARQPQPATLLMSEPDPAIETRRGQCIRGLRHAALHNITLFRQRSSGTLPYKSFATPARSAVRLRRFRH